jgi:hypothetical protein
VLSEHSVAIAQAGETLSLEQQALNRKQMDAMYQLTRALDLSAKPEQSMQVAKQFLATFTSAQFTVTPYHIELYFRIGEYYFNRQQYSNAIAYYEQVLGEQVSLSDSGAQGAGQSALGVNSSNSFYAISAYMLGWSHFKLDNYPSAMHSFATMLDASLLSKSAINASNLQALPVDELGLGKGDLRLVKDALRVMALTFSYEGDATAIASFFDDFGARDYDQLIYDELAQQHLDNDRFQDSARVLLSFANQQAMHPRALEFYIRHIDAFVLGDFPERVLTAKESFVNTYSLGNGIVANANTPIGRDALPYLRTYLTELAQSEHSLAQSIESILKSKQGSQNTNSQGPVQASNALDNDTGMGNSAGFVAQGLSNEQSLALKAATVNDLQALSRLAYSKAKDYYQNYIRTFTPDPSVAPLRFYLAEALLALNELEPAIEAFETYAYIDSPSDPTIPAPAEAAYAALLVHQNIAQQSYAQRSPEQKSPAKQASQESASTEAKSANIAAQAALVRRQKSQAKFANTFSMDKRAPAVALTLMQDLFAQQNYKLAQLWASWLLFDPKDANNATLDLSDPFSGSMLGAPIAFSDALAKNVSANMRESAKLVTAHSYFALQAYREAELAYRELLLNLSPQDPQKAQLSDRLAASLYKQAESLLAINGLDTNSLEANGIRSLEQLTPRQVGALEQAVVLLQQVVSDTANSEFSLAAQYDSAIYFTLLEKWPQAIATFIDFKAAYPQNPLSQGIDDQLFYAYQQSEDWPQAARLLMQKYSAQPSTETGRLALFQAAEYFQKAGNTAMSLDTYRTYAHQFPAPMAQANEARFILSEIYLQSNEQQKRRFWLNKLVQAQQAAMNITSNQGQQQASTPRSVYLGSMAAMVFASDADNAYTRIKLTQPLAKSLSRKQSALNKAIAQYERVISFGSAQYVTAANYQLGKLYSTLANDLMDSDRPNGLSALESSQYEILLEEQAYPFEETAIDLHEKNIARVSSGLYDEWIKNSFQALVKTMPARYNKPEVTAELNADDL